LHPTLRKLKQGDRRSIGRSNEVVAEVLADPRLFRVVFSGLSADDPLVRMRAADAVEKITAQRPELLRSYKNEIILHAEATDQKEIRWHLAQMLPRLDLSGQERKRVYRVLLTYLSDRSSIVRTFAMQALADIARDAPALLPAVRRHIAELTLVGTPAMKARGRKLLGELGRLNAAPPVIRKRRTR
jgi:HEAT repeat protein